MTETDLDTMLDDLLADQGDPHTLEPAPYPGTDQQDVPGPLEDVRFTYAGRTMTRHTDSPPAELRQRRVDAIATGLALARAGTVVGVGFCLRETRELLRVGPLWPDATTAWENTDHPHPGAPGKGEPFGVPLWWTNDGPGHVALDLRRDGLCLTTDYVQTGRWGVAPIANLAAWCGGRFRGWSADINGTTIYRKPDPWGHEEKVALIRAALDRALDADNERRVNGLRRWLAQLED